MTPTSLILALAFFLITTVLYVGITILLTKRARKGRHPINKDIKLLRQPGEGIREKLEQIDERMSDEIVKGVLVPAFVAAAPIVTLNWLTINERHAWIVFGVVMLGYFISLSYRIWKARQLITERKNYRLGLVGERVVAEALEPLKAKGYHVFHDVPAQGAEKAFNLDHVVIGRTGIYCIETKARRKHAAKNGGEDHKVGFDGTALLWPNAREEVSVRQARKNAEWLGKWLLQRLGRNLQVTPFLVVPGWFTEEALRNDLRVLSHQRVAHHIQQGPPLDAATIDLVARQLDSLCRTVPCEG